MYLLYGDDEKLLTPYLEYLGFASLVYYRFLRDC